MILGDKIGLGGTLEAPEATVPAYVGYQGKETRGDRGEVFYDEVINVLLEPHPLATPLNSLHWDGDTYKIGGNVKKHRRGTKTHHLTLTITKIG